MLPQGLDSLKYLFANDGRMRILYIKLIQLSPIFLFDEWETAGKCFLTEGTASIFLIFQPMND